MLLRFAVLVMVTPALIWSPMLAAGAAADPRDAVRGGRLPIPKPQLPRAAPPAMAPGGKVVVPEVQRRGSAGSTRPPSIRPETQTVCIGGRAIGRSCLCADGSTRPALGQRVVRCPDPMRRR